MILYHYSTSMCNHLVGPKNSWDMIFVAQLIVISCREHDKGPDELSVVLRQLMDGDLNFTVSHH